MAKQDGFVNFEGTLDNLTFYKTKDGHFIRTKGGVSKERIKNDPAFVRTRENGVEFGSITGSGKLLRNSLGSMLFKAKDSKMTSRLVRLMGEIKNMDTSSKRGDRNVGTSIVVNPDAKAMLLGFNFNAHASLGTVLNATVSVDAVTGVVTIASFNPMEQMRAPEGATHFSLQTGFLNVDFTTGIHDLVVSPEEIFPLVQGIIAPVLTPSSVPTGTGIIMNVLLIEFFQEVNAVKYMLNNGAFNVLQVVGVE